MEWETLWLCRQSLALVVFVVDGGETPLIESNEGNTHRYMYGWQKGQSKAARIRFALLCSALAHAQRVGLCCPRPWSLVLAPRFRQGGWQSSRNWDLYWVIIYCPSSSRLRSSQNREIIGNNFACWIDWFAFLGSKSKLQFSFVSVSSDEEYFCGSSLTV